MISDVFSSEQFIFYIEKVRNDKKMTIQDLTRGIISRRSYSRFLSNETEVTFDVITKLIDRLGYPMVDFSLYVNNQNMQNNIEEAMFVEIIKLNQYDIAFNELYPMIKDKKWRSSHATKALPCAVIMMNLHLKKISSSEAYYKIKELLHLDEIVSSTLVFKEDIDALYIVVDILKEKDKLLIGNHLFKVLDKNAKVVSPSIDNTTMLTYLVLIKAFIHNNTVNSNNHELIQEVIRKSLEYLYRSKTAIMDIVLFDTIIEYARLNNYYFDEILFGYISTLISSPENYYMMGKSYHLSEQDKSRFLELLSDQKFIHENYYARIIYEKR